MWLPKDERRLLSYCYRRINKVETSRHFKMTDLVKALGKKQVRPPKTKREIILDSYDTIEIVNDLLSQRGLITWENLDPGSISVLRELPKTSGALSWSENTNVNFRITLTLTGYALGRKYNSWWLCSNLWYTEYIKNHWIWLVIAFLGGILSTLLVNWLTSVFGAK